MAAPTTVTPGWETTFKSGTDVIGCSVSCKLTQNVELIPALCKSNQAWRNVTTGRTTWFIDFDSFFEDAASPVIQAGSTGSLTVASNQLKGWDEVTLTLEADVIESVNKSTGLAGVITPTTRRADIAVSGDFYDPLGTGADAHQSLQDIVDGTSSTGVAIALTYGDSGSISFTGFPANYDPEADVSNVMRFASTLQSSGAVTDGSTNEDTGIGSLLAAFFGASGVTSVTALMSNQSTYSQWTGTAYPIRLVITISYTGNIKISGQMLGSGALTHGATA